MNPFPFQQDALPSMSAAQPPPHQVNMAPPPHQLPGSFDNFGGYMPEVHIPGYGNAFAEAYVFEPLPIPGEENFSFDNLNAFPSDIPDADSLAAIWCSIEEDVPNSSATDQFNIPSASTNYDPLEWNISAEQAINEWSTLAPEAGSSVGQPMVADWSNMAPTYDPSLPYLSVPYNAPAGPSSQPYEPPVSAPLTSAGSYTQSFDVNRQNVSQGVFLSSSQPLSPVESSWTEIPRQGFTAAGASLGADIHSPQPVRYVSSSAFPDTPMSVGTAGWTERTTSFGAIPIHSEFDGDHDSLFGDDGDERHGKSGYSSVDHMVTPDNYFPAWSQPVPTSARSVSGFSDFSRRGSGVSAHSAGHEPAPHSVSVPAKSHMPVPPPVHRIASTGSVPIALPSPTVTDPRSGAPSPLPDSAPLSVPIHAPSHPRGVRKARVVGQVFKAQDSPASALSPK